MVRERAAKGWIDRKDGWLAQVTSDKAAASETDALIRQAWLRTQSREPDEVELDRAREHMASAQDPADGLRDLLWALINSQEFLTNH